MKILLNNIELILKTEVLDISSANPFLDNDEERLDNIFSVEIPIVGNEKALGYIDNIDVVKENEYSCEIISSLNFIGVAIVTEASTEENKATLQIGYAKSNFNYLIKDKKMQELNFGTIQCAKKLKIEKSYPHVSTTQVSNTRDLFELLLQYKEGDNNYFANNKIVFARDGVMQLRIRGGFGNLYTDSFTVCYMKNTEFVRVKTVYPGQSDSVNINAICNIIGNQNDVIRIFVEVNHTNSMYMTTLFCALDFDCTIDLRDFVPGANADENANYVFPMIQNNGMADQFPDCDAKTFYNDTFPLMNNVYTNEKNLFFDFNGIPYTKIIAPCLKVSYILDCIAKACNYTINKTDFDIIYDKLIIFTGTIIGSYKAYSENFYIDIPAEFELSKCFENGILVKDFLQNLYIITGFFPIFDHEIKSIELVNIANIFSKCSDIQIIAPKDTINYNSEDKGINIEITTGEDEFLKDNYNDLEDYNYLGEITSLSVIPNSEINDCYYIQNERKYYAYKYGKATDTATINTLHWECISLDIRLNGKQGKETFVDFKSEIPILVGSKTQIIGDGTSAYTDVFIPVTKQKIRIDKAYETIDNKYSNSFMIIRGHKTKDSLGEYLFASADSYFFQTNNNELSLRIDKENGIMKRMYENIAKIYCDGKKHTINGYMTAEEIKKLTYKNSIYINNSVNILLSYNYKHTKNDYKEIELELIKI